MCAPLAFRVARLALPLPPPPSSLKGSLAQRLKPVGFWLGGSRFVTMGPPHGSFAELVTLAERTGQAEVLPVLAQAGARNIADLTARADRWVAAGVSPLALETMLAAPPPAEEASALALVGAGPSRPDLPVRRDAARASWQPLRRRSARPMSSATSRSCATTSSPGPPKPL